MIGEERDDTPINTTEIAQRELEIIGSRNGTRQDMAEGEHTCGSRRCPAAYRAARFPLDEINAAFDCVRAGASAT